MSLFDRVNAPWTEDQMKSLAGYQGSGWHHPFTYGDGPEQVDLVPTEAGWIAKDGGPIVQDWAYQFMLDWRWVPPAA